MSMPELGSKISLISKADIRYEGKLFTVDPQECTIALSHGNIIVIRFNKNLHILSSHLNLSLFYIISVFSIIFYGLGITSNMYIKFSNSIII